MNQRLGMTLALADNRPPPLGATSKTKQIVKMKIANVIRIALASLIAAGAAHAAPINGSISIAAFGGGFSYNTATNTVTFAAGNNGFVNTATGSYVPVIGAFVHYNSFVYPAGPGALVITPLWATTTLGPASFNLSSITSVTELADGSMSLLGNGTAFLAGTDVTGTPGRWSFSANTSAPGVFNWASTNVSRVPDGGATLALLGLSVLGLGGVRRFLPSLKN